MEDKELKACPFCGGEAELKEYNGLWLVVCGNLSCKSQINGFTKTEAITAWNTRVSPTITGIQCSGCDTEIKDELDGCTRTFCNTCLEEIAKHLPGQLCKKDKP